MVENTAIQKANKTDYEKYISERILVTAEFERDGGAGGAEFVLRDDLVVSLVLRHDVGDLHLHHIDVAVCFHLDVEEKKGK